MLLSPYVRTPFHGSSCSCVEKPWSMPGGSFVCVLAQKGIEKHSFHLVGTPFLAFQAAFSLEERSLVGGP